MSSANRNRRRQNREARSVAAEEALLRSRRQRIILASVGLGLAAVVGAVLVTRAAGNDDNAASSTTSTTRRSTTSTASTTSTTLGSATGKPCVAVSTALPAGAPTVPVPAGPPPKTLVKLDLKPGTGAVVKPHSTLTLNNIGVACSTGKIFSSTFGQPQSPAPLDGFIRGWREGIPGMKVGGQRLLGIPPRLAYGVKSPGFGIAPNETLWFVVEVTKAE